MKVKANIFELVEKNDLKKVREMTETYDCSKRGFNYEELNVDEQRRKKIRNVRDTNGRTVLHHAVKHGFYDIVLVLLKNGAYPNELDSEGLTPLDLSMLYYHQDIEALLRKYDGISTLDNIRDLHKLKLEIE